MICQTKPLKKQAPKENSIDSAFSHPAPIKVDDTMWSPFTAGPYLVPVTRWIE